MSNDSAYVDPGYWQPVYSEGDAGTPVFTPLDTIASQYANSPTILQLVTSFWQQVSPDIDFQMFYSYVWNLATAQGFGLDIQGRIINLERQLTGVPAIYPSTTTFGTYAMTDRQYRRALTLKAYANISNASAQSVNKGLMVLADGRGNAFVRKVGTMKIRYIFYFAPEPYEYAIILSGNVAMRPAGVDFDMQTLNPYFGFSEGMSWDTFGRAVFAAY